MSEKIVLTAFGSLWSATGSLLELGSEVLDERSCRRQVRSLLGEDRVEGLLAAGLDLLGRKQEAEQALRPVEPAPQVVVLAERALEEGGEVVDGGAAELRRPGRRLQEVALERADAQHL